MPRKLIGTSEEAAKKILLKNYMDSFKGSKKILTKDELNEKRKGTIFYRHKNRIKYASGVTILGD